MPYYSDFMDDDDDDDDAMYHALALCSSGLLGLYSLVVNFSCHGPSLVHPSLPLSLNTLSSVQMSSCIVKASCYISMTKQG